MGNFGCCTDNKDVKEYRTSESQNKKKNSLYSDYYQYFQAYEQELVSQEIYLPRQPFGLKSMLNNCYMNAAIQLIAYKPEFVFWLNENYSSTMHLPKKKCEIMTIWMIFFGQLKNNSSLLSTAGFISYFSNKSPVYAIGKQSDTVEVLYEMLDDFQSCENFFETKELKNLFELEKTHQLTCNNCEKTWEEKISTHGIVDCKMLKPNMNENIRLNLLEDSKNSTLCRSCNSHRVVELNVSKTYPQYLLVNFVDSIKVQVSEVVTEETLILDNEKYMLRDLLVYEGNKKSGHYYVIKFFDNDGWYVINNTLVKKLQQSKVIESEIQLKLLAYEKIQST